MRVEQIGGATLYLGDCREIIPQLVAGSCPACEGGGLGQVGYAPNAPGGLAETCCELCDGNGTAAFDPAAALVSDPPYGAKYNTDSRRFTGGKRSILRGASRSDRHIIGDDQDFDPTPWTVFDEVILWGAHFFSHLTPPGTTLIWLKKYPEHYGTFLSDAEIAWQKGGCGVYAFHAPDSNGRRRMEATGSPFGDETSHPTQKPIALMEWCLQRVAASTIIDPYCGSGSTGVACARLGRKFIGIEIDEKYFNLAVKRITEAYRQADLFIPQVIVKDRAPEPSLFPGM